MLDALRDERARRGAGAVAVGRAARRPRHTALPPSVHEHVHCADRWPKQPLARQSAAVGVSEVLDDGEQSSLSA